MGKTSKGELIMVDLEQGTIQQEDLNVSNSEECQSEVIIRGTFEQEMNNRFDRFLRLAKSCQVTKLSKLSSISIT